MFKKTPEKAPPPRERGTSQRSTGAESAITIIGPGMQIDGDLLTDGTVRIEGLVRGTIRAGKAVVLGQDGEVLGDIVTQDAVIGGRVTGTVVAESRLELQSSCVVEGEIRAPAEHLKLEEGARFNGQIRMLDAEEVGQPLRRPEAEPVAERAPESAVAPVIEG
jgi:cytoskeletal protein CcmA (bactofilin family)